MCSNFVEIDTSKIWLGLEMKLSTICKAMQNGTIEKRVFYVKDVAKEILRQNILAKNLN